MLLTLQRPVLIKAFLASFSLYLLPQFTLGEHPIIPFAFLLLGWVREVGQDEPLFAVSMVAFALVLQVLAGAMFYWIFHGGLRRRAWILLPAVPTFLLVITGAYWFALPSFFLVGSDPAPERGDWAVACVVPPKARLETVSNRATGDLARVGEVWLERFRDDAQSRYAVLAMPGCTIRGFPQLSGAASGPGFLGAKGTALWRERDGTSWYLGPGAANAIPFERPLGHDLRLILGSDGRTMLWKQGTDIMLHDLTTGAQRSIMLPPEVDAVQSFDAARGEVTLGRNDGNVFSVGLDGKTMWGPVQPLGDSSQAATAHGRHRQAFGIRRWGDGWVAVGRSRSGVEVNRLVWVLPGGAGRRELPKGTSLNSMAVDPGGDLIAVSAWAGQASIFVFRSADGVEVFRRRSPEYRSSGVAFLGGDFLAVSRSDFVEVLEVPRAARTR